MREGSRDLGPVDQRTVRRHNLGLVLRHVAEQGSQSRARIASETGLNKTTVSSLAAELIERGLLREVGPEISGSVGRPGVALELSGDSVAAVGLEINVDYLSACATDLAGRLRHRAFVPCDNRGRAPEKALDDLATVANGVLDVLDRQGLRPVGATVALPGLVDLPHESLLIAPNLGWTQTPVKHLLEERLATRIARIRVGNDADLGALGELWEGLGQELRDFVFVGGAVGIGAGVICHGELLRGASGFGGEIGHITVNPDGPRCVCGNVGCLELYAGQEALLERIGMSAPAMADGPARWPAVVAERARRGDERTNSALEEIGGWLAVGLTSLANLLNPAAIVLGGFFAPLAEWIVPSIQAELEARVLGARWSSCSVLVSKLGEDAAVRGAAASVLHDVLTDPSSVGQISGVPHTGVPAIDIGEPA